MFTIVLHIIAILTEICILQCACLQVHHSQSQNNHGLLTNMLRFFFHCELLKAKTRRNLWLCSTPGQCACHFGSAPHRSFCACILSPSINLGQGVLILHNVHNGTHAHLQLLINVYEFAWKRWLKWGILRWDLQVIGLWYELLLKQSSGAKKLNEYLQSLPQLQMFWTMPLFIPIGPLAMLAGAVKSFSPKHLMAPSWEKADSENISNKFNIKMCCRKFGRECLRADSALIKCSTMNCAMKLAGSLCG